MGYMSDIEIAQSVKPKKITEIAKIAGVDEKYLELYGNYKAKVDYQLLRETDRKDGKLVLVTAITPTPAGEGKTTTSIGLADGLRKIGKNSVLALREPSLGPVFGVKGGAAGGGYAQVIPMEDINLHFTGDFHAIGAANNLIAAMLDNHIYQSNSLRIDPKRITWKRCVDMNDRQLRQIVDGLGVRTNGVAREDGYDITVASEIMAVLCLSSSITDLKARLGRTVVGELNEGCGHCVLCRTGREKRSARYAGEYYRFPDGTAKARATWPGAAVALYWLLALVYLRFGRATSHCIYALPPFLIGLVPGFYALMGLFTLLRAPERMTVVQRENGPGRLTRSFLGCGVFGALGAAGGAVFLTLSGQWAAGWVDALLMVSAAACAWCGFAVSRRIYHSMEKIG